MNAIATLLAAVARRLRLAWAIATGQLWLPLAGVLAIALVGLGFLEPWGWPEPAAVGVLVAGAAGLVLRALTLRVPPKTAARAADRGLDTRDAFATALEVDGDGLGPWVVRRAEGLAAGAKASDAVPMPWRRRLLGGGMASVLVAIALTFAPNHQDDVRAQRAREREAIEEVADDLREQAAAIAEDPDATEADQALAEELERIADELDDASSLEEAEEQLEQAQAELSAEVSAGLESQRAAAVGLERSLGAEPLPGASSEADAAEQLEQAAEALDELSPEEQAALADQLEQLAEGQAVANPELAGALSDAAAALDAGDLAGARAALGEAAAAQAAANADVAAQDAAASGAARLGDAAAQLGDASQGGQGEQAAGEGQGDGNGDGQGDGNGNGNGNGQGQGQGQGQGNGSGGQGQGGGAGSGASGNVGGTNAPTGSGQGGAGRPAGSGNNPSVGLDLSGDEATVYDPGDTFDVGGNSSGDDPGATVGEGNTGSNRNGARVPVQDVIADYERRATDALERGDIPPSLRALVRAYFDLLAGRSE